MTIVRLAFTRRWLGIFVLSVVFALACYGLSQWQFARREEAQAAIRLLNANYDRPAVALESVLSDTSEYDQSEKWRTVRVVGEYDRESIVYVRTRSGVGGIGFEQLAPLRQADGTVFIIDRGWLPANSDNSAPAETSAVPTGEVTVTARLIPGEQLIDGRQAPAGQIATINLETLDSWIDGDVYSGWYGRLATEAPTTSTGTPWEKPVLDEGPHLSYALQWWVFAIMGFIAYGWALRKEARGDVDPAPKPMRRTPSDEDVEDAAVDSMRAR